MENLTKRVIACRCGAVELTLVGDPIMVNICHCDECQRGSAQLEALPGAPKILDAFGGSPYVLYRKDRVTVSKGAGLLAYHRIEGEVKTKRATASCCGSPLFMDFEPGHWLPIYQQRFTDPVPKAQIHIQTRFLPAGKKPDDGLPLFKGFPPRMIFKLIKAKIAMGKWKPESWESETQKR